MKHFMKTIAATAVIAFAATTASADKIRIALAETPSDELAAFFVALDRAKANGLTFRPLAESAMDVLEWWDSDAVTDEQRSNLMSGERSMMLREPDIIAAWKGRQGR